MWKQVKLNENNFSCVSSILTLGDSLKVMQKLVDDGVQVDSIVTDPPYELGFMGKVWDSTGITFSKETWELALKLLKPGGHLLAFSASRNYHRMAVAIEDAGFEIRDQLMWIYGSGFPKSLNLGDGWGTALKPAHEPIVMARKFIEGTNKNNREKYGTGGINIDGCRIPYGEGNEPIPQLAQGKTKVNSTKTMFDGPSLHKSKTEAVIGGSLDGRFPANVMHDGSEEVVSEFPSTGQGGGKPYSYAGREYDNKDTSMFNGDKPQAPSNYNDAGSAARFFYCAKVSKSERGDDNTHPTVKPQELMKYLCRLVTPKGGIVLDPFMGSGSTGMAAKDEGFGFIGIEREKEYFEIAEGRITATAPLTEFME